MLKISLFFWQMCLLRRAPGELPTTNFAMGLIVTCYLLVALATVSYSRPHNTLAMTLGTIIIGFALQALITWGLHLFKGVGHRFRGTWLALLGTNAVMLLVLLPFYAIILNVGNGTIVAIADTITWVFLGWWLAIASNIYHKSLNLDIFLAFAITFLIELLSVFFTFIAFPPG